MIVKCVSAELAYTVWIERQQARLGGRQDITPFTPRVTMIYRPEDGEWKIVHGHADPITTPEPVESAIQEQLNP